jgi:DNA-binding MarR family transcriptional regulator
MLCAMPPAKRLRVSPLEAHLGFWLRRVSNRVSGRFREQVEEAGCSVTEWVALRQLYDDRRSSHAALMAALGMTKGAVSKVVSRLEARGLVARKTREDARGQALELTPDGRRLVPRLARLADRNDEAFFACLGERRRAALMATLRELAVRHRIDVVPVD